MIHLTLTGYYAGHPYCDCDKQAEKAKGNTFCHMPYSHIKEFLQNNDICPKCRAIWDDTVEEDTE